MEAVIQDNLKAFCDIILYYIVIVSCIMDTVFDIIARMQKLQYKTIFCTVRNLR